MVCQIGSQQDSFGTWLEDVRRGSYHSFSPPREVPACLGCASRENVACPRSHPCTQTARGGSERRGKVPRALAGALALRATAQRCQLTG